MIKTHKMSEEELDALEAEEADDEGSSDDEDETEDASSESGDIEKKKKKKKKHKNEKKKKKKKKHTSDDDNEESGDGKKRILIVEDERPLAHALELKLSHDGYDTITASNGEEGLKKAKEGDFDLMLLDLILPGLDGFEILRSLKEAGSKIPVVILSNLGQEEDKQRVQDYGVAQYCVKSNMPLAAIVSTVKVLTA